MKKRLEIVKSSGADKKQHEKVKKFLEDIL